VNVIGGPGEHVQLTDRLAVVQWLRVFLAVAVVAIGLLDGDAGEVVPLVAAYLVLTAGVEVVRRRVPGLVHPAMSWMLLLDGVFLALALVFTGGADSWVRPLVFFDVTAVTLVVSYRTGLKLGSDRYRPKGPDLAFDRRAQGDQPRIDDGFGAGRFQERAHRQPAGRHDDDEPDCGLEQAAMLRPELLCEFRAYLDGRLGLGVRLERLAEHGDAAYCIQAGERRGCLGLALGRRLDLDGQPIRRRRHGFAVG